MRIGDFNWTAEEVLAEVLPDYLFPGAHDAVITSGLRNDVLWSQTPFPFDDPLSIILHLLNWRRLAEMGMSECTRCGLGYETKSGFVEIGGECPGCEAKYANGENVDARSLSILLHRAPDIQNCNTPGYVSWKEAVDDHLRKYDERYP
jgi:hypothetical protein